MSARFRVSGLLVMVLLAAVQTAGAQQVCNVKVVTDANPDYYDMPSMVHSITGKWQTTQEKCWALFYWNHIARRQTSPMTLHGMELTDPIRQFNDYGFTMCSTVSGINCSIWEFMGLKFKFWDISNHTVCEVEWDGRYHMHDSSLSALYTLCDGKTIAGVEDIGKTQACAASGGKSEPGHIAKYHCLYCTSRNGFLSGADCARALDEEFRCFNPNGLKFRYYYSNKDRGHRFILNLRPNEVYTRTYRKLGGDDPRAFYVPNHGKDPESVNVRYHIRGNGIWTWKPGLTANELAKVTNGMTGVVGAAPSGVMPAQANAPGEVVFKIEGANVITALMIKGLVSRRTDADAASVSVSTTNGLTWQDVWKADKTGELPIDLTLIDEVNGAYEVLVKVTLLGTAAAGDARLAKLEFETNTEINSKTQPKLLLGANTVYVGLGDQTDSIVFWPELQAGKYRPWVVEEKNMVSEAKHPEYMGVMHAGKPDEEAYVVFRIDAPRDITKITYGGRLYNRAPKAHIDFLHSFDGGKTWEKSYSLTDVNPPWDVIRYQTVDKVPPGTKSVLFKYLLNASAAGVSSCSIYAVRMEANYKPVDTTFRPIDVTFTWDEVQKDYSKVRRSHTSRVDKVPFKYTINVGGEDHPVMESLRVNLEGPASDIKYGYSDGKDVGGQKYAYRWVTYGTNLAEGKPYTVSVPSDTNWGAGDPDGRKLTDGVVGPPYSGGIGPGFAALWTQGKQPVITVDLGKAEKCGVFRIEVGGYEWWDAIKGQVKDKVEVLTSLDDKEYTSRGFIDFNLRWKDLPANYMWPDDETFTAFNYALIPPQPVDARYVRYNLTSARFMSVSEVQVFDFIRYDPFDLKIALPDEK